MLFVHISLAIASMLGVIYALLKPSQRILQFTYVLTTTVIFSGIALGVEMSGSLGHLCLSGLIYLGFMIISLRSVHKRFNYSSTS